MTIQDFSNMFDTLLNSYSSVAAFGEDTSKSDIVLDEFEKSVFLTKAQDEIVLELYSGKNPALESFEDNEAIRKDLANLIKTTTVAIPSAEFNEDTYNKLSDNSIIIRLPEDLMLITYEQLQVQGQPDNEDCEGAAPIILEVLPVKQDDYIRSMKNPFRTFNKRRAFRLDIEGITDEGTFYPRVELVTKYSNSSKYQLSYLVRYLSYPTPIILTELPQEVAIKGITNPTECVLNPLIHSAILDRAVRLALLSKSVKTDNV